MALVGAETPEGARIRQALADRGVPGERVNLFGRTEGEAVLSEYAGEARLIQEPETAELMGHDVIFLCETSEVTRRILSLHEPKTLVVDAVGCTADREDTPIVHMDINPGATASAGGVIAVPHGISAILSEVLHAVDVGPGVRRAAAVVLRPAVDFGEEGLEELREQTVRLFNFGEVPREVIGAQLSFNVIPERLRSGGGPQLERRVEREVGQINAWDEPRLAVRIVNVPVFHGHAAFVQVEVEDEGDGDAVADALDAATGVERTKKDDTAGTPVEIAGERRTVVADLSTDATGASWIWLVAGELGSVPAELAVRLAAKLKDL
jgi:aspartate-semialdehyde dehydrogenase